MASVVGTPLMPARCNIIGGVIIREKLEGLSLRSG
jgi:hypothetical protein